MFLKKTFGTEVYVESSILYGLSNKSLHKILFILM